MAVITFHSLEDRRVKRRFAELTRAPELPAHLPLTAAQLPKPEFAFVPEVSRKGVLADEAERDRNPRSRSARLRAIERVMPCA